MTQPKARPPRPAELPAEEARRRLKAVTNAADALEQAVHKSNLTPAQWLWWAHEFRRIAQQGCVEERR